MHSLPQLTAEDAYAHLAALGLPTPDGSNPDPISFHCPEAGCFARTQVMIERLQSLGVPTQKVWALKPDANPLTPPRLMPRFLEDNQPIQGVNRQGQPVDVEWTYHLAPVVLVDVPGGGTLWLVLDPALSHTRLAGPISIDTWHSAVGTTRASGFRDQTVLGQAPRNPYTGGSYAGDGYMLGATPPGHPTPRGFMADLMAGADPLYPRPPRPLPGL
jgi:hypothetical protein